MEPPRKKFKKSHFHWIDEVKLSLMNRRSDVMWHMYELGLESKEEKALRVRHWYDTRYVWRDYIDEYGS